MKKIVLVVFVALLGVGCAGSKKAVYSPVGSWDYVVATPNGDVDGTMVLTEMEEVLTGKLVSDQGEFELEDVVYSVEEEVKSLNCKFYFQGMELVMTGTFEADAFTGNVDLDQMGSMPMTAVRRVDQ